MSKQFTKLAGRYALALHKACLELGVEPTAVAAELAEFVDVWQSNSELSVSLQNPFFSKNDRMNSLKAVLDSVSATELVRNFILSVFERERVKALPEMSKLFSRKVEQTAGIVRVQVKVARELEQQEKSEIESSLGSKLSGQLEYQWSVDPSILGGLVVEYEGHILDGSLSGRLDRLERELLG